MSIRYRYLQWDGSQQEFHLEADELFREFSDFLMEGWTPDEALDWIIKQGVNTATFRVMGVDDLRSELGRYKDNLLRTYDFKSPLNDIREELDEIVQTERDAVENSVPPDSAEFHDRKETLDNLPHKLSSALEALSDYEFLDGEAKKRYEELMEKLDDINKVERFNNRYGDNNTGNLPISFEDALDIIEELENLDRFDKNLMTGNFEEITPDKLREMLNENAFNSFVILREFKADLSSSGYIDVKGTRAELTPKGIRKIGEMALRDVFSSLKKSRFGGHHTPDRGEGTIKADMTKDYEFGDPFNLDVVSTLKNSLTRGSSGGRINIAPEDFEVYESEYHTVSTTALLLDLSWSMSFQGRFPPQNA